MIRTGIGIDLHRFSKKRRLILGGVEIPGHPGLSGHSDADVLCHAIMDAMLGATGMGDIGVHFPNTDLKWKDARSLDLLAKCSEMLDKHGFDVVNIDSTIIAETPCLSPFIQKMRTNIAEVLNIDVNMISIKATTAEKMGAIGKKEGMVALAVVTVKKSKRSKSKKD
jgi:2-C-methyl-D-erythritol 2,4-cyclodiphosphate synthase